MNNHTLKRISNWPLYKIGSCSCN